jgi:uncharacterized protein YutE (UPF0331/DUF86 family)
MMVKAEIIRKRLRNLDEYLEILSRLQQYDFDSFVGNPEHYGSAERFLHLAIEAINDMGNHIVADENLGETDWYSDIPRLLAENGYIDAELRDLWIRMIGFRNVLVHQYAQIDRRIVYDVLQNQLGAFAELRRFFALYL